MGEGPLPADPGAIIYYDQDLWRQEEFELFSWNRLPEVLIFDTASYTIQSRMFKRLAFFVEKERHQGQLLANEKIERRHGYNAHDYRAEDLARFFQAAWDSSFPLNPEELRLREILLENNILRRAGNAWLPGSGAVLSISRSSSPQLRRFLLGHELYHGIFFSYPAYRNSCFALWDELEPEEKSYWKLLFDWVGYDLQDRYLLANELQAYLFQQERAGLEYYFKELFPSRLIKSYPEREEEIRDFLEQNPTSFERAFDKLQQDLWEHTRFRGGRVFELYPL